MGLLKATGKGAVLSKPVLSGGEDRTETFVRLLGQSQRRLSAFVFTLVPIGVDAEEILQETNLVLWREFDRFQLGSNFLAWASKVAFHQVLAYRKRKRRDRLCFSEAFLSAVADEVVESSDLLERRHRAMGDCIQKLPPRHQHLVRRRYFDQKSVEFIASETGRTVGAVYRVLSRIRQMLHDCVSRRLVQEARR